MSKDIQLGIVLKADGSGLVGQVRLTEKEFQKLKGSTARADSSLDKYEKTSKKASQSTTKFRQASKDLGKDLFSLKSIVSGLVAGLSVTAFAGMIKGAMDAGDRINKLSIRLGASTEALSQYKHVAELSGVTFETLTMGWQRMTRRVSEAANGTGEAVGALNELGLSAKALEQLAPEQQFEILAQKISEVKTPADQVRLAMKLFDSEGVSLVQTMQNGAAGLQDMRREADELGLTLTEEAAQGMADANDAMTRMRTSGTALANTLAVALGPTIAEVADWFRTALPDSIIIAGEAFAAFRHFLLEGVETIVSGLSGLSGKMASFASYFNDDIAASLQATSDMYAAMAKDIDDLQFVYATSTEASKKFNVATQENAYSIKQFEGETISSSEALNRHKKALKDNVEELDVMGLAMDAIDAQFKEVDRQEALKFAGLDKTVEDAKELGDEATAVRDSFKSAFKDIVKNGEIDFEQLTQSIANKFIDIAVDDIFNQMFSNVGGGAAGGGGFFASLFSGIFSANGNAFNHGELMAFANGGVVGSTTFFGMNSGLGVMGEAGPEAIMPLKRGANGQLGVQLFNPANDRNYSKANNVTVVVNNNASGTESRVQQSTDQNGDDLITVFIDQAKEAVASDIAQGGSSVSNAIESTYGVNRAAGGFR